MTERDADAAADEQELEGEADEVNGDVDALTREEVRRRAEAPLPRSLLDFLR